MSWPTPTPLPATEILTFLPLLRHLSAIVYLRTGSPLSRQDLVGEACLALLILLPRFDETRGTLQGFVVARALGAMRDAVRLADHSRSPRRAHDVAVECAAHVAAAVGAEVLEEGTSLLAGLHPRQRHIAIQRWVVGRTAHDIALEYAKSEAWVFLELRRVRDALGAAQSAAV